MEGRGRGKEKGRGDGSPPEGAPGPNKAVIKADKAGSMGRSMQRIKWVTRLRFSLGPGEGRREGREGTGGMGKGFGERSVEVAVTEAL